MNQITKRKLQKTVSMLLTAVLLAGFMVSVLPVTAFAAEGEQAIIQINKVYLKEGVPVVVDNPANYTLHYFVDGTERTGDTLVPTAADYEKWITVKAYDGEDEVCEDKVYFSHLPVIYINTDDGGAITSKDEYKDATLTIQNNTEVTEFMYDGVAKIKGRGNSSWRWPKKPYRIKLDKKTDLFGMGKNKNWVLLANYLDESLLRNTTAAQLSHALGHLETMDTVWTDVVLNGEYAGNFQLCEKVDIDEERVNIFNWEDEAKNVASAVVKAEKKLGNILDKDALENALKENFAWVTSDTFTFNDVTYTVSDYYDVEDNLSGGYLLELSNEFDELSKFLSDNGLKVMVKSPEYLYTNEDMMASVQQSWQDFENALRSEDGYTDTAAGRKHYSELADFDSMVSYWLVMEIMGNQDAGWKSRYVYKDLDAPFVFGPPWDFDYGCGSSAVSIKYWGWMATWGYKQSIFDHFVDDPYFLCKASERYWQVRPFLQNLVKDGGLLDEEIAYLYASGMADEAAWDRTVTWPDKARGFYQDTQMFKTFMTNRIAWLDTQFATDDKIVKSTFLDESAAPYTRDTNVAISPARTHTDIFSVHAPADGVTGISDTVTVHVGTAYHNTAAIEVYVNGRYHQTVEMSAPTASFTVESSAFTEAAGSKNMIALIAKDAAGNTLGRNFATVLQTELPENTVGDVNFDWQFDINDATYLQRAFAEFTDIAGGVLLNFDDAETLQIADLNSDHVINIRDVTAMQRQLANL